MVLIVSLRKTIHVNQSVLLLAWGGIWVIFSWKLQKSAPENILPQKARACGTEPCHSRSDAV